MSPFITWINLCYMKLDGVPPFGTAVHLRSIRSENLNIKTLLLLLTWKLNIKTFLPVLNQLTFTKWPLPVLALRPWDLRPPLLGDHPRLRPHRHHQQLPRAVQLLPSHHVQRQGRPWKSPCFLLLQVGAHFLGQRLFPIILIEGRPSNTTNQLKLIFSFPPQFS